MVRPTRATPPSGATCPVLASRQCAPITRTSPHCPSNSGTKHRCNRRDTARNNPMKGAPRKLCRQQLTLATTIMSNSSSRSSRSRSCPLCRQQPLRRVKKARSSTRLCAYLAPTLANASSTTSCRPHTRQRPNLLFQSRRNRSICCNHLVGRSLTSQTSKFVLTPRNSNNNNDTR